MPRIFYLTLKSKISRQHIDCRTIATDLDEALRHAVLTFGPVRLISSGYCAIPAANDPVYGRGRFLSSKYDYLLPPQALFSLCAVPS